MKLAVVGNCLYKIVRAVSLGSIGFLLTTILAQSVRAQAPNDPLETHTPPREHQEFLRKAREGELVRPDTPKQQQLKLAQIREDFRQIQLVNADKIRPALAGNKFDYKNIARASSEIKRRAVRLKSNLALSDSEGKSADTDNDSATYLGQMKRLDALIWSFVSNSIFRNTGVIDVQQAGKANRDLREIIKVSEWLKRRHN